MYNSLPNDLAVFIIFSEIGVERKVRPDDSYELSRKIKNRFHVLTAPRELVGLTEKDVVARVTNILENGIDILWK